MSTAAISYSSLGDAASEAKDVAKKLDKYADSINKSVYKKLSNYGGSWTDNITNARSKANSKINELRDEAGKYRDYAEDLKDLKKECERVDEAVKTKVFSLTASFKANHDIKNNHVVNQLGYLFTSIGNSTSGGRWLNTKVDEFQKGRDYLKQCIEDWYDYEGGKEFLKGIAVAALEIAIAVLGVLAVVLGTVTGVWAVVVAIAAVVGGVIAAVNGVVNLVYEFKALGYADDDPATARRNSNINSMQEEWRVKTDSEAFHIAAGTLDVINIVCSVITLIDSGIKFVSGGIKWVKQTDFKKIFAKENFKSIKDIALAFKQGGINAFEVLKDDFLFNLKNEFFKFKDMNGVFDLADTFKSIKNMLSIPKELIEGDFSLKSIGKVLLLNITLPSLTLFSYEDDSVTGYKVGDGGQMQMDFREIVTFDDAFSLGEKGVKSISTISETFKNLFSDDINVNIDIEAIEIKFAEIQPIDISIPPIPIPDINVGRTQAA